MSLAENAATIRPAPCAHGSRSLRPMHMGPVFCVRTLVGSPVAAVSGDSPACDLALFAHPFVEGAASGRLQRSCIGAPGLDKSSIRSAYRAPRFFESLMQQPWGHAASSAPSRRNVRTNVRSLRIVGNTDPRPAALRQQPSFADYSEFIGHACVTIPFSHSPQGQLRRAAP